MSYRYFDGYGSTQMHDGPPPTVAERAKDEVYANAVNALAAVFRFDLEDVAKHERHPNAQMAYVLRIVANQLLDGWSVDALPARALFDDYGPEGVLTALRRAYAESQPSGDMVGD